MTILSIFPDLTGGEGMYQPENSGAETDSDDAEQPVASSSAIVRLPLSRGNLNCFIIREKNIN